MNTRRNKIENMLVEEPDDEFLRYSLALEMNKDGDLAASLQLLQGLCSQPKPYVPAYFRSAQILADENRIDASRQFLREGIEAARNQGDLHAAGEMSEMLADLGQFGD